MQMAKKKRSKYFPTFQKIGRSLTTKTTKKLKTTPQADRAVMVAFLMPFIAVLLGSIINPSGWASFSITALVLALYAIPAYWLLILVIVITLLLVAMATGRSFARMTLVTLSVLYSSFVFLVVAMAEDEENIG